jgi:hypothetical protein
VRRSEYRDKMRSASADVDRYLSRAFNGSASPNPDLGVRPQHDFRKFDRAPSRQRVPFAQQHLELDRPPARRSRHRAPPQQVPPPARRSPAAPRPPPPATAPPPARDQTFLWSRGPRFGPNFGLGAAPCRSVPKFWSAVARFLGTSARCNPLQTAGLNLKTGVVERLPWVRIPPPPLKRSRPDAGLCTGTKRFSTGGRARGGAARRTACYGPKSRGTPNSGITRVGHRSMAWRHAAAASSASNSSWVGVSLP